MFEPVWLGNNIVPRWEALLFVGGLIVLWAVAALIIFVGVFYALRSIWKQIVRINSKVK